MPDDLVNRQPFPGPGLAIRVLCSEIEAVAAPHQGVAELCRESGLLGCTLPLRSVGVQGDSRSYEDIAIISGKADHVTLNKVSTQITNRHTDVNRVVYCINENIDLNSLCVGNVTLEKHRVDLLREVDALAQAILEDYGLTPEVCQFPVILIPVSRAGNSCSDSVVLRPVYSVDGMTAEFAKIPITALKPTFRMPLHCIDIFGLSFRQFCQANYQVIEK